MAAARRRSRQRKSDAAIVSEAFSDPRRAQERAMYDARRRAIVGDGADPVLAGYPLGVMYARRIRGPSGIRFGEDHKAAAEWFIRLYKYRNGACTPKGALACMLGMGGDAPEREKLDAQFRALMCHRRMWNAQVLVCPLIYDMFPRWLVAIIDADGEGDVIPMRQAAFVAAAEALRCVWVEFGQG